MTNFFIATFILISLPLCFNQQFSSSFPIDDYKRIIPVTLIADNGVVHDNHSAQICNTRPPEMPYRKRLSSLHAARQAEKRGLDRRDSGLDDLGLDNVYDVLTRDHPDWDSRPPVELEATDSVAPTLIRRANPAPQIIVETYFHIVSTRDQSQYYTEKRRNQIANNQVGFFDFA